MQIGYIIGKALCRMADRRSCLQIGIGVPLRSRGQPASQQKNIRHGLPFFEVFIVNSAK